MVAGELAQAMAAAAINTAIIRLARTVRATLHTMPAPAILPKMVVRMYAITRTTSTPAPARKPVVAVPVRTIPEVVLLHRKHAHLRAQHVRELRAELHLIQHVADVVMVLGERVTTLHRLVLPEHTTAILTAATLIPITRRCVTVLSVIPELPSLAVI